ncbi:unnamed protein product, partial [Rotaria sp. Silwood2]
TASWKRLFDELKDTQLYIKYVRTEYQGIQQQLTSMTKKLSKFSSMMLSRNEPDFGRYRDPNVTQNFKSTLVNARQSRAFTSARQKCWRIREKLIENFIYT